MYISQPMQQKLTQNKAKINYVGLLQSFARVLIFSIVFLKNVSVNTFFYIKNKIVIIAKGNYTWNNLLLFYPPRIAPAPPAEPTLEELYKKDINFYKTMTPEVANSNINPTLYDPVLRKTLFTEENNPTEKYWRSQLLFEHTQRGNIIMYYDAFRMSFAYYSDEQIVSYQALYHAAMKYSVRFRCRNFFIDMETFPDNPMIEVLRKEDESLKTKTKKEPTPNNAKPKQQENNPVFARLKNYKESGDAAKKQNKPKHPFSNKFVRIGKMCEFNILQRPPNKKIEAVNSLLFSDKPMSSVTDFFDDDDETLSLKMPISGTEDDSFMNPSETPKETPITDQKDVPINPFSGDQPKMTSYQLFKMMKKNQEKSEGVIPL